MKQTHFLYHHLIKMNKKMITFENAYLQFEEIIYTNFFQKLGKCEDIEQYSGRRVSNEAIR